MGKPTRLLWEKSVIGNFSDLSARRRRMTCKYSILWSLDPRAYHGGFALSNVQRPKDPGTTLCRTHPTPRFPSVPSRRAKAAHSPSPPPATHTPFRTSLSYQAPHHTLLEPPESPFLPFLGGFDSFWLFFLIFRNGRRGGATPFIPRNTSGVQTPFEVITVKNFWNWSWNWRRIKEIVNKI